MNAIVVYTSKYGSTEKYARWLAEALGCPAKSLKEVNAKELAACDTVLYGGSVFAGSVKGFRKFLTKLGAAEGKRLVLFMVGMASPAKMDIYDTVAQNSIPGEWKGRFAAFALWGDSQFSKMNGIERLMMRVPKMEAEKVPPEERDAEMREFLENFGKDMVHSSREQIGPILEYLQA